MAENIKELLIKADKAFDEGDYDTAATSYRCAAELQKSPDDNYVLENLWLSEEVRYLSFLNNLLNKYPDHLGLMRTKVWFLTKLYNGGHQAIQICSAVLEKGELTAGEENSFRLARMAAAISVRQYDLALQDFLWKWNQRPDQRKFYLRELAQIGNVKSIPAFEKLLADEHCQDETLKRFIKAKIEELAIIASLDEP